MIDRHSLTGVWSGLYAYDVAMEPVCFTATLVDAGGLWISGTTHETDFDLIGNEATYFAMIQGTREGQDIRFTKSYDGSGGRDHHVDYAGQLSADQSEIAGMWTLLLSDGFPFTGKFLMVRSGTMEAAAMRTAFEVI